VLPYHDDLDYGHGHGGDDDNHDGHGVDCRLSIVYAVELENSD